MDFEAWRVAFLKGLGRALQRYPALPCEATRPVVLDACLRNVSYDPQIDGTRAEWMVHFVQRSDEPQWFIERLGAGLAQIESDWDARHALELAARLARAGHGSLGAAVRAAIPILNRRHDVEVGVEALLLLDGDAALLPVLQLVGARLLEDTDAWVDVSFLQLLEGHLGKTAVTQGLREAAHQDRYAAAVVVELEKSVLGPGPGTPNDEDAPPGPFELEQAIAQPLHAPGAYALGVRLSDEQVRVLLDRLDAEEHASHGPRILKLLRARVVSWRREGRSMPRADVLHRLARRRDEPTRGQALELLRHAEDPQAVTIAREVLQDFGPTSPAEAFSTLGPNCEAGDVPAILRALRVLVSSSPTPDRLQHVISGVLCLAEGPAAATLADAVIWVYEQTLCGHCRGEAVLRLAGWGVLDDARRSECRDDAFEDVRAAAGW